MNSPGTTKLNCNSKSCGTWLTQPAWSMRYKYLKSHAAQHTKSNQYSNTQTHPKTTGLSLHGAFGQGAAVTILFVSHGHLFPDSPSASHDEGSDLGILPKDKSTNHHVQSLNLDQQFCLYFSSTIKLKTKQKVTHVWHIE